MSGVISCLRLITPNFYQKITKNENGVENLIRFHQMVQKLWFLTAIAQKSKGFISYHHHFIHIQGICFNMSYMVFARFDPRLLLLWSDLKLKYWFLFLRSKRDIKTISSALDCKLSGLFIILVPIPCIWVQEKKRKILRHVL